MRAHQNRPFPFFGRTRWAGLFFLVVLHLSAQRVLMENYTMENGLATNVVHNIFQDSNGFMWFMTRFGLSRYDGARFNNFTTQNGLASNFVYSMYEDQGILYVATDFGMQQLQNGHLGDRILEDTLSIEHFFKQKDGSCIFATDNSGILRYSGGRLVPMTPKYAGPNSSLVLTPNGSVLTGGSFSENDVYVTSLKLFDPKGNLLVNSPPRAPVEVHKLFADPDGNIWVCAVNGLYLLSMEEVEQGRLHFLPLPEPFDHPSLKGDVEDMLLDRYGNYWIATAQGLIRISPNGQPTWFTETDGLVSNKVLKLFEDRENNLWAGTLKGITKISLGGALQYYTTQDGLGDNDLQSVLVLNGEQVFVTTTNGRLQKFDPVTMGTTTLATIRPDSFFRILKTHTGELFVASNQEYRWTAKELHRFDPVTGMSQKGYHFDRSFFYMETDAQGNYFLAGNYGLYVFDPRTGNQYTLANITDRVNQIVFDKDGNLWAGMWNGKLFRLELLYGDAGVTAKKDDMTHLMDGAYTTLLYPDSKGAVWVGSRDKGVTKIFRGNDGGYQSLHITPGDGLMSPSCHVAAEDGQGSVFVSSQLGMDKLLPVGDSYKVLNFSRENNFYDEIWDVQRTDEGVFWVATASGLVRFVDRYTETLPPPRVHITEVINKAENKSVHLDPMDRSGTVLPFDRGNLQFYFAALYFVNEKAVRYSYRLLGSSDGNWNNLTNGTTVSYAGLRPGKYRFEVRSLNWNDLPGRTDFFVFEITPPWWTTWWFLVLVILGAIVGVYYFVRRRIKHIRFKAEMERKIADTEMKALRAQMNPHFIFNCINNIDALVQSNDRYNATIYLNKFAKLLRNVLDSSQERTVSLAKDMETLGLYVALEQLRDKNKYDVAIQVESNLLQADFQVPPLIIQPIVENAIIHGLRKKKGRDGKLVISVSGEPPYLRYVVEDNGVGRTMADGRGAKGPTSYGTQMSQDRVRFFNNEEKASVIITDLKAEGVPSGTRVELLLRME